MPFSIYWLVKEDTGEGDIRCDTYPWHSNAEFEYYFKLGRI